MQCSHTVDDARVLERALLSEGRSDGPVYDLVAKNLASRCLGAETLVDLGCGSGNFWKFERPPFDRYVGVDVVKYAGFPIEGHFVKCNFEDYSIPLPSNEAEAVVALEIIEHLDNPRAFMREVVRLLKPAGWLFVTTPNQLSILSKMTLLLKNQFNAFQAPAYPAHRTALLEVDLVRIANESRLSEIAVDYTDRGRMPFCNATWPRYLRGRHFSDNVLLIARKPADLRPSNI